MNESMRPSRMLQLAVLTTLLAAAPAQAIMRLPAAPAQVAHNPAERLLALRVNARRVVLRFAQPDNHHTSGRHPGQMTQDQTRSWPRLKFSLEHFADRAIACMLDLLGAAVSVPSEKTPTAKASVLT